VGYISMRLGLSEDRPAEGGPSPAYKYLLEMANAYESPRAATLKSQDSKPPFNPVLQDDSTDEALIAQAIEVIRREGKASVSMLQRRLRLGYTRSAQIMDRLESWGVVGPSDGANPRKILNLPPMPTEGSSVPLPHPPVEGTSGGAPEPEEARERDGRENSPAPETAPSAAASPAAEAPGGKDVGIHNPGSGNPVADSGPTANSGTDTGAADISDAAGASELPQPAPSTGSGPAASTGGDVRGETPPPTGETPAPPLPPGVAALRWFAEQLPPTSCQMQAYLPNDEPVPDPLPDAVAKRLQFRPISLLQKRGLTPETCAATWLKANPRANEKLLQAMPEHFDWDERQASGLWLEADRKRRLDRRPNTQFCGKGQVGKKPEKSRRDENDKWQWGWCEPVLIPYFNEAGELVKLRPHKGGAASGTAAGAERIYVPRDYRTAADTVEKFPTVIVCEGEFKAIAIWQEIGAGAALNYGDTQPPIGVCALPGISFAKNMNYRADLEEWLRAVECRRVMVAFDDEDKSDKPLRQRFDAVKYARYLALDLSRKLKITGLFIKLPEEWRTKGKADWDGGLVKLLRAAGQNPKPEDTNQHEFL
jgi:hypothetical protein